MTIVKVLIFRGTGGVSNKAHPYYGELALVRAGHVGLSGVIEGKIIGFHPTPEIGEALGEEQLIKLLGDHIAQPGRLQDDTVYFERAYELIEATEGRTTVYEYEVEISEERLSEMQSWYTNKQEAPYNFPNIDGSFAEGEYNCAVFIRVFGIPLPMRSGELRELIRKMKREEYEQWKPKPKQDDS